MVESRRVGINRDVAGSPDASGWSQSSFGLMYWVYILENPAGRFYTGQSEDVSVRLGNHNRTDRTAGKYTRKNGPWKLVWSEAHPTRRPFPKHQRRPNLDRAPDQTYRACGKAGLARAETPSTLRSSSPSHPLEGIEPTSIVPTKRPFVSRPSINYSGTVDKNKCCAPPE